ncbi:MAG: purine-nucleoside phosphorylase [Myxococcota bacterium]|nr:purine-nucleoside phosphorylase [Myxococcota bacterium]MEE2780335.1 purine-nucleoside phosphorylase [Myxococcota bacterium]
MSDHPTTHGDLLERLEAAAAYVRGRWAGSPGLGVIAGSGLGALGGLVDDAERIPYGDIPHMPAPTVVGHAGQLVLGTLEGLPVAVLSGRVHRYEGHPMEDVVFGARLLATLGCPAVLLTNAAGGIPSEMGPGSLCRLTDHINFMGQNPLFGPNVDALGPRFPDMTQVYSGELACRLEGAAASEGVTLESGVYAAMAGPSYETPAEIRMLRTLGVTVVGMSTVPEAIALRHMGVQVCCISVVSNAAAGVGAGTLDHSEVKDVALEAGPRLLAVVRAFARGLKEAPL